MTGAAQGDVSRSRRIQVSTGCQDCVALLDCKQIVDNTGLRASARSCGSEKQLQSELDLTANRRAVTQLPEDGRAYSQRRSTCRCQEKCRRVRQVEKLGAKLQRSSFHDSDVLES